MKPLNHPRSVCLRLRCLIPLVAGGLLAAAAQAQPGYYGYRCLPDGTCQDPGVCVRIPQLGGELRCTPCGAPGEPVCVHGAPCGDRSDGYVPIAGVCQRRSARDRTSPYCGFPGTPPCPFQTGCDDGVLDRGRNACLACGQWAQPCCVATSLPCDYGGCTVPYPHVGGVCLPRESGETRSPSAGSPNAGGLDVPTDPDYLDSLSADSYLDSLSADSYLDDYQQRTDPGGGPPTRSCLTVAIEKGDPRSGMGGRVGDKYPYTCRRLTVRLTNRCETRLEVEGVCRWALGHGPDGYRESKIRRQMSPRQTWTPIASGVCESRHVDSTVECSGTSTAGSRTSSWNRTE